MFDGRWVNTIVMSPIRAAIGTAADRKSPNRCYSRTGSGGIVTDIAKV
jgi:hypothetical protein